jgi:serine/threonine protein kinase
MDLVSGTRLGPYEIQSPSGKGGMGEVYRAKDIRLGRDVAIKILPQSLLSADEPLKRFEREAKALASISHPNILTIFDVGNEQGVHFVVTEFLNGNTLRTHIPESGLSWQKALEIAIAISEGLVAAHSLGIIHRDLKPENIFITSDRRIKILDFGLARFVPVNEAVEEETISRVTKSHVVFGTVPYMSPEQIRGMPIDERSDIFSFGCLFYEMLTGRRPFQRESSADITAAILKEQPLPLNQSNNNIPQSVEKIVLRCLEKEREKRFQKATDLVTNLKALTSANNEASLSIIQKLNLRHLIAVLLVVLTLVGLILFRSTPEKTISTLAVLPFKNASANHDVDFLSEGISERITSNLSQLPQLRVKSRSTVYVYKDKQIDPRKIGKDLNVGAVLMGSVLQRGENLTLRAELVDTNDGTQLWGDEYNRSMSDIFQIQEEIATEISKKLQLKLTPAQQGELSKRQTHNVEAYQLYMKGRYYWNKRTQEAFKKAKEYFLQALDKDPTYALAYAGLADYYAQPGYNLLPPEETYPKAIAAAKKALDLDPMLAEPHVVLAMIAYHYNSDPEASAQEFRKAIDLNPSYATAHQWYSLILSQIGKHQEAINEMKLAMDLDPLSPMIQTTYGDVLCHGRQYDRAIEEYKKAIEMDPNFAQAYMNLGTLYEIRNMRDESMKNTLTALRVANRPDFGETETIYKTSGWSGFWKSELDFQMESIKKQEKVDPYRLVRIYLNLDDKDKAIEWCEKYFDENKKDLTVRYDLQFDPMLDRVRSNPRFIALMKRVTAS